MNCFRNILRACDLLLINPFSSDPCENGQVTRLRVRPKPLSHPNFISKSPIIHNKILIDISLFYLSHFDRMHIFLNFKMLIPSHNTAKFTPYILCLCSTNSRSFRFTFLLWMLSFSYFHQLAQYHQASGTSCIYLVSLFITNQRLRGLIPMLNANLW